MTITRILIVEDDGLLAIHLEKILTRMGYQVAGKAANGEEAIKLALTLPLNVILMDIHLRGEMTGITAAEEIHKQSDTPIIYLTAYTDELLWQQAKITAAYAYLTKPVRDHELRASIEMALYKYSAEQKLEHLNQVLRAVRDVNKLLTREHDRRRLLEESCKILLQTRGYKLVWIGEPSGETLSNAASAGVGSEVLQTVLNTAGPNELPHLPVMVSLAQKHPVICHNMLTDECNAPWQFLAEKAGFVSSIAIPILQDEKLFGALCVFTERTNVFDDEEVELLVELANDLAFGLRVIEEEIARKQSQEILRRHLAELEVLYESGLAISSLLEPQEIGRKLLSIMAQKLNWHHAVVRLYHAETDFLETLALEHPGFGPNEIEKQIQRLNKMICRAGDGLSGWVIKYKQPVICGKVKTDPRYANTFDEIQSGVYIPIRIGETILGSIAIESEQENAFNEQDARLLTTIANQAAIAIQNAQQYSIAQREIAERKITEQTLRQSEEKYRHIVETASEGIWAMDTRNRTTFVNQKMASMLGYTPAEMLERPVEDFIFPDELDEHRAYLQNRADRENDFYERCFKGKDGSRCWCQISATMLKDIDGNFAGSFAMFTDITQRKQAEAALLEANTKLEQRVAERTSDLSRANAELARAMRTKDEFLANMSHELRTPLNNILVLSESLSEQIRGPLNERQLKSVNAIEQSGRHLLSLINDILDISKIEAGKIELDLDTISVATICESCMVFVSEMAHKKNQELSYQPVDKSLHVIADARRLKQIIVNLLNNAIKFTPVQGKISLEVETEIEKAAIHFHVRDTGIGISPEFMPKLFQPFTQHDSSLSRMHEGTGLGLALVQRLVELHNGSITVESSGVTGAGSCFTVSLPWEPSAFNLPSWLRPERNKPGLSAPSAGPGTPSTPPSRIPNGSTLLLAEDNEANILAESDYLRDLGYEVIVARNGHEAVQCVKDSRPDLILMDIQMPDFDGLEAIQYLRMNSQFDTIPIIALTALAMPGDRERCLQAGANAYLTKPVSMKYLVEVIQHWLKQPVQPK